MKKELKNLKHVCIFNGSVAFVVSGLISMFEMITEKHLINSFYIAHAIFSTLMLCWSLLYLLYVNNKETCDKFHQRRVKIKKFSFIHLLPDLWVVAHLLIDEEESLDFANMIYDWVLYDIQKPEEEADYLILNTDDEIRIDHYYGDGDWEYGFGYIKAWMPLPDKLMEA